MMPTGFRSTQSAVKRSLLLSTLLAIGLFSLSACGDATVHRSAQNHTSNKSKNKNNDQSSTVPTGNRYDSLPPLNLAPGSAVPGVHLRPGIEIVTFDAEESKDVRIDAENMTAEVSGQAKDKLAEQEEIWSGDIVMGEDFIYRIEDIQEVDGKFIVKLGPFELLDVIHGEWDIKLGPDSGEEIQEGVRQQGLEQSLKVKFSDNLSAAVSGSTDVKVRGGVDFPTSWEGDFQGKISVAGKGVNTEYNCNVRERRTLLSRASFGLYDRKVEVTPDHFCIDYILVKGSVGMEANYGYTLTSTGKASFKPEKKWTFLKGRAILGTTGLAIYFEPYFKAGFTVSIEGELSHDFDGSAGISLPMGFDYRPATYGFTLLPNERHPVQRNGSLTTSAKAKASANAKLSGQLGMGIALSDAISSKGFRLSGPKAGAELVAESTVTPAQFTTNGDDEACFTAELYARAFAEAQLNAELDINSRWTWSQELTGKITIDKKFPIAEYENNNFCFRDTHQPQELYITMSWAEDTDLDLHLKTPSGEELHYRNRDTSDGGVFLGDSCIGGKCDDDLNSESIQWEQHAPPSGEYEVWAVNYNGAKAAQYTIEVSNEHGIFATFTGTVGAIKQNESQRHSFQLGRQANDDGE